MKTHKFFGKNWRIVRDNKLAKGTYGYCEPPDHKGKRIKLPINLEERELLTYAIHEALHACCWWMSEEWVHPAATDIARFLWRLGFRLKDD